jgi:dihydrofolate reductase
MAKLIYSGIMSLDGYVADQAGKFDWSMPDTEVHTAVNDLTRSVGTFLLGRRMYEVLVAWETMDVTDQETAMQDFAKIWWGRRQGRVLQHAGHSVQRQDAHRR